MLAKMMEVIVEVRRVFVLVVSAKKTETMYMPSPRKSWTMMRVEAAGENYKQVQSFTLLESADTGTPKISMISLGGPAHAGCASGGTYVASKTNRKQLSPSQDSNA